MKNVHEKHLDKICSIYENDRVGRMIDQFSHDHLSDFVRVGHIFIKYNKYNLQIVSCAD